MLKIWREIGETVVIGEDATMSVTVMNCVNNMVYLAFKAPRQVRIWRQEIYLEKFHEKNGVWMLKELINEK